jgi:hypothetical protein
MKLFNRLLPATVLGMSLVAGSALPIHAAMQTYPVREGYPSHEMDLRGVVDRTQTDLRAAADLEQGKEKQRERYRNAQGHLSSFDRHLVKGKFDRSEIGKAIDDIKDILDHNVLQASSRDALMRDLEDLRIARERR